MPTINDARALWNTVQDGLRTHSAYQSWIEPIVCDGGDDESLSLVAPSYIGELWVNRNYQELLTNHITLAAGRNMRYTLRAAETLTVPESKPSAEPAAPPAAPREPRPVVTPAAIKSCNTFENFIVGPENELAHSASLAVANDPGKTYTPLFIYGATGLGKTHLMHAIAHAVLRHSPDSRILYVTSEVFTNDYITAVQERGLPAFRRRYRDTDVLLIDDIHFLAGKERTQEEFFHTFNELHNYHRQIVLTSDRPVSEITSLEDRLVSRFSWGYTADIGSPRLETRMAILRKKAGLCGLELSPKVIEFLATRISRNVRNLEGAILRLHGYKNLGREITPQSTEEVLHDLLIEEVREQITAEGVQKRVAEYYRISLADMTGKRRTAQVAFPRQVAMSLCVNLTSMSLTAIGEAFGGRDHGTVIHARRVVEERCATNPGTKREVDFLIDRISKQRC
ncbi:MAG: chromosomal replication initiator protein DnaA [Puniceicoccales bacterium]|nr:chromosomal replication initiator protein DnaA [Puniceicoccales bacterium]